MMVIQKKVLVGAWVTLFIGTVAVLANQDTEVNVIQDNEVGNDKKRVSSNGPEGSVTGRLIVGTQDGWKSGRVEEKQLLASAELYNYEVKIQTTNEVPCENEKDSDDKEILVFLPRSEGLLAAKPEDLKMVLLETNSDIVVPTGKVNALVGWSRSVRATAKATGATSLSSLAQELRSNPKLRHEHNVQTDVNGIVFHLLDDLSSIGNQNLEVVEMEDKYELRYNGLKPCVILASPDSQHARSLLLVVSDYLVGTHRPKVGCVSCLTHETEFPLNVSHRVMVAVFITKPQPFLEESLSGFVKHGLNASNTHFLIYNQVEKYKKRIERFVERLQEVAEVQNITLIQASGNSMGVETVKNMALKECLRLNCEWYINVDSYTFMNPQVMAIMISLGYPVIAPAFTVQGRMPSSFWREIDAESSSPSYSWDHAKILNDVEQMRGYWHSSCLRGIYAIRRDVLVKLSDPYSNAHKVPENHHYPDPDLAFCAALREQGIPMIATSAFPHSGVFVNITYYKMTEDNLLQYESNPVLWTITYIHRDVQSILSGNVSLVERPCHEIYDVPVFNELFGYDIVEIANRVNKWSPALTHDPRKELGIEPVPTVDQWLSQLGLKDLFDTLNKDIFMPLQKMAYPLSNPFTIGQGLVARFRPDELPGLPKHHDAAILTMFMNLTPLDEYKGGEIEFPTQECKFRADVGHLLMFPSRLTHPKLLHNVTEGVLHKLMLYNGEMKMNKENGEESFKY